MKIAQAEEMFERVANYATAGNDKKAHKWEDSLFIEVLLAIRDDNLSLIEMRTLARIALRTLGLEFKRNYA